MSDKPILFSAPMIRALLDGRKTQTRRVIPEKTQDAYYEYDDWCRNVSAGVPHTRRWAREFFLERSRIQPGDRLWCREGGDLFREAHEHDPERGVDLWRDAGWRHSADGALIPAREYDPPLSEWVGNCVPVKRPSIHMPKWASRLTLIVTDVRVQRLQEISNDDACEEGVEWFKPDGEQPQFCNYRDAFADLWDSINGPGSWEANPWIAAYTFTVHRCNIDALATPDPAP